MQRQVLQCAGGGTYPIVGRGNLILAFRSGGRIVRLHVKDVDHAPGVRHHLLSLTRISNAGHTYIGAKDGFRVELKSGSTLKIPGNHRLLKMYAHRADPDSHDKHASACAVIAPGAPPNPRVVDINDFHCSHAHAHEGLLRQTAKQLGWSCAASCDPAEDARRERGYDGLFQDRLIHEQLSQPREFL